MLGSETEARFIHEWVRGQRRRGGAPDGWARLGEGCSRTAYLSPSGVVYKVQIEATGWQSNEGEAKRLRKLWLRKVPKGCRLPRFQFFDIAPNDGVIAMERVSKTLSEFSQHDSEMGRQAWSLRQGLADAINMCDSHGGNFGVDESTGELIPIDLGSF